MSRIDKIVSYCDMQRVGKLHIFKPKMGYSMKLMLQDELDGGCIIPDTREIYQFEYSTEDYSMTLIVSKRPGDTDDESLEEEIDSHAVNLIPIRVYELKETI